MKNSIILKDVEMKDYFSKDFSDLLHQTLNKQEDKRLGLDEIKAHKFFKNVNWDDVVACK